MRFSTTFIVLLMFYSLLFGQTELNYNLDSVVVTTNRVPVVFSDIGRSVNIISQKEIEQLPASNIQDILEYNSGIDVRQRGPESVQADISIRGGSFKQTLILVDGIKLSDPQTGHHNMNLPVSISQIERIEILKGQGARIHGANAFSGVINLITKKNALNNLQVDISGGENNFYKLGINSSVKLGNTNHNVSFSRSKSDGYRHNTEFEQYNFSINNSFNLSNAVIKTIYGYTDKDFGANSFYTSSFPDQAEKTKTHLAAISADLSISKFNISPKVYWRNNEDEFVLKKHNPLFYKNNHETNVYGGEIQGSTNLFGGYTSFGYEYTKDKIVSNNLGKHNREQNGFFLEQKINVTQKIILSLGGFVNHYSNLDWKYWPGIDLAFNPLENLKLYANYGRAFRLPTYTELYYNSPTLLGNSNLKPEETTNYEFGINYSWNILNAQISTFRKEGTNLIDYQLNRSDDLWYAKNINKINTNGFEIELNINLSKITNNLLNRININYTYLDSDKLDIVSESRYVIENLRHDLSAKVFHNLFMGITQSWALNYEERISLNDNFTVDTKLSKRFSNYNIFLKASNLFNESFEEFPGVILPGRWIVAGVQFNVL